MACSAIPASPGTRSASLRRSSSEHSDDGGTASFPAAPAVGCGSLPPDSLHFYRRTLAAAVRPIFRRNTFTLSAPARHHRRLRAMVVQHPSLLHQQWIAVTSHQTPLLPQVRGWSSPQAAHREQGPVPTASPMKLRRSQLLQSVHKPQSICSERRADVVYYRSPSRVKRQEVTT